MIEGFVDRSAHIKERIAALPAEDQEFIAKTRRAMDAEDHAYRMHLAAIREDGLADVDAVTAGKRPVDRPNDKQAALTSPLRTRYIVPVQARWSLGWSLAGSGRWS